MQVLPQRSIGTTLRVDKQPAKKAISISVLTLMIWMVADENVKTVCT
jgi:hypothetical protein